MAGYVDGFVIPVSKKKVAAYKKMAQFGRKIWMDHGALQYFECMGDDLNVPWGPLSFPKGLRLKSGETVAFSFIIYKSKAHRDAVNAKVMKDKRMANFDPKDTPFEMRRMMYGGFKVIVEG